MCLNLTGPIFDTTPAENDLEGVGQWIFVNARPESSYRNQFVAFVALDLSHRTKYFKAPSKMLVKSGHEDAFLTVLACCNALLHGLWSVRTQHLRILYMLNWCLTCWKLLVSASASADGNASPTALSTKSTPLFSSPPLPTCLLLPACLLMADCTCSRCAGSAEARHYLDSLIRGQVWIHEAPR